MYARHHFVGLDRPIRVVGEGLADRGLYSEVVEQVPIYGKAESSNFASNQRVKSKRPKTWIEKGFLMIEYLDAASGSFLLTAIAGGVAGSWFFIRSRYDRIKKRITSHKAKS